MTRCHPAGMPRPRKRLWKDYELQILSEPCKAAVFWDTARNGDIDLDEVGIQDQRQVYLWRACAQHLMFQSFKSVIDNFKRKHGTSMNCKVCEMYNDILGSDSTQKPSQWEVDAYRVMSSSTIKATDWLIDVRLFEKCGSSADIWIPHLNLIFMVDGEGHFFDQHGRPVSQQYETDEAFNFEALDGGVSVLRLHFEDRKMFQQLMLDTIAYCGRHPSRHAFVKWSPHFGEETLT